MQYQSGQGRVTPLKLRHTTFVPATLALRASVTSTLSSSARQTFPTAVPSVVKDCFGLHSDSSFGSVAQKESGVGQQSVIPLRSITASSPTLSICSRRARLCPLSASLPKVTDLLSAFRTASATSWPAAPTRPAMASSGAFGSSGLPAAPSGRLAAAAAHRAALRDCDDSGGEVIGGGGESKCDQDNWCSAIRNIEPVASIGIAIYWEM